MKTTSSSVVPFEKESLRPLVVPALGHSGPPPWSLRPSTLVTPALHPGHSGPPPWSLRPSTLVIPAYHPIPREPYDGNLSGKLLNHKSGVATDRRYRTVTPAVLVAPQQSKKRTGRKPW
ncbi:hypothetical protein Pmani_002006 [Petrolisthes manimaculis]|uniref:Uncharacterized protein n=1 Tax=Petrolisthes manimaculis TaxID=1843537 RepID=A0AAE1QIV6_9EUCA|nr:hypothetical protein Pmani_002006 [Petrolisthes manimaculis]